MMLPVTAPLEGKSVVITGAGRGIGAAYARYTAQLGASVLVADVDESTAAETAAGIEASGGTAIALGADIRSMAENERLAARAVEAFGKIDGWVNNAGIFLVGPIWEIDPAEVERLIHVNVLGTIYGLAAAAKTMIPRGRGSIVNVTSGAQSGGLENIAIYGTSKGAVASLTYNAARDLLATGVRVNAVSPIAATAMTLGHDEYAASKGGHEISGAMPPPENNAPAVAYLLSDRSSTINGQVVRIDSDRISIGSRPGPVPGSAVEGSDWTYDAVAEAFTGKLGDSLIGWQ